MPEGKTIRVHAGTTVLGAAGKARVAIRSRCGGNASCLMCKVRVDSAEGLSVPQQNEKRKLGEMIDQSFRLACQAKVTGNCTVTVPEDPLKAAIRAQLAMQQRDDE